MGSGKTMIGEALAKKLNKPFADIDKIIENKEGMPIKDIFKNEGEAAFRAKEKKEITDYLHADNNAVISVGGGAFLQEETRDLCLQKATVVFLHISWDAWLDRMDMIVATRPVLHGKTISDIYKLYEERQAIYAHHHHSITVDYLDAEEASDKIIEVI